MTWGTGIEWKGPWIIGGQTVERMRVKAYSHRVICLRFVPWIRLLCWRLKGRVGPVHRVKKWRLRTFVSVHLWNEDLTLPLAVRDALHPRSDAKKSDYSLEAIQLYSLQFNYYHNTLFPFSINDLGLIKSVRSENLQAAGCLIVMKTVKFKNERWSEVSSKE